MKYLVSGGGTGGHIYPALAIINEIKRNDKDAKFLYVGTENGLEARIVPREGIDFKTIRVKGMPRRLNKQSFIALKELLHGLRESKKIIRNFKPDIVIGTGGFVCGPVVYQGSRSKIPTLIHEQNAFPGITNKILGRFVDKIAVTFDESIKYFKDPNRITVTGNPIREEILKIDKNHAYKKLNIDPNKPFVLSFGGSGGQKSLNDAFRDIIKAGELRDQYQLIHVTGERFYDSFIKETRAFNMGNNVKIMPYLFDIPEALNIADLIVTSSGAITLAEISAVGIPSILIPKGYTAENHQEYNARAFERNQASEVILDKDLNAKILSDKIFNILSDQNKLEKMKDQSKALGKIDAASDIYKLVEQLILK